MTEAGSWRIIIQRQARRQLRRLPADVLRRVMLAIDAIGQDPYRGEMLTGFDYRKWRVGDWRIIYAIEDEQLIVLIIESNLWIGGVNVSQKLSRHRL